MAVHKVTKPSLTTTDGNSLGRITVLPTTGQSRSDITAVTPAKAGTQFSDPREMEG